MLRLVLQEDVSKMDVINSNNLEYTFTKEDFPGCKITGAYFENGKFYRMPVFYYDFNEEDRKVDIEIKADKEEYKPGEEVVLEIKTTNAGKAIESFVNISVVNEAVFAVRDDEFNDNILERVYCSKNYPAYTYSSHLDYLNAQKTGGRRWRRKFKIKFWRYGMF